MKKFTLILILCTLTLSAKSQNASVEQSVFGIQTGLLGVWAHNESRLSNLIALRSEVGFDAAIWGGSFYDKTGFILAPAITLEPRLYYNLNKRVRNERRIDGNSGNFISLKTSYLFGSLAVSNHKNVEVASNISIVPTWGIRRNIGNHFNYETGIGVVYVYHFAKSVGYTENKSFVKLNLSFKIGYRF